MKIIMQFVSPMQQELAENAPATAATAPASPTVPLRTQAARHVGAAAMSGADGDAQLPARPPVKLAAQAQSSATQVTKQGMAKIQRSELRQQILEKKMEAEADLKVQADELAALDAEDTTELSDNDSCK